MNQFPFILPLEGDQEKPSGLNLFLDRLASGLWAAIHLVKNKDLRNDIFGLLRTHHVIKLYIKSSLLTIDIDKLKCRPSTNDIIFIIKFEPSTIVLKDHFLFLYCNLIL